MCISLILLWHTNRRKIFSYCVFGLSDIIVIVWTKFRSKACQEVLSIFPIDNKNKNMYIGTYYIEPTNLLVYFLFIAYTTVFFIRTILSVFLHCFQWPFIEFTVYFSIMKTNLNHFFLFHSAYQCTKYSASSDRCHSPKLFITITLYVYPV